MTGVVAGHIADTLTGDAGTPVTTQMGRWSMTRKPESRHAFVGGAEQPHGRQHAVTDEPRPLPWTGRRVIETLEKDECLRLLAAGQVGRLAYTGRDGPTVLPVLYRFHEGSIIFFALQGTFMEEDLRTGIAHADYHVAFEIDQIDPGARRGWAVQVAGPAHHVDTQAERASIVSADADPLPAAEAGQPSPDAEAPHLMRLEPIYIRGRRSYPALAQQQGTCLSSRLAGRPPGLSEVKPRVACAGLALLRLISLIVANRPDMTFGLYGGGGWGELRSPDRGDNGLPALLAATLIGWNR
jgi:nitroimidazol reductase NimA-like FMN-containing flavoprotein (pyridoxamine 5'-phosphate oxidase superfamily)